MLSVLHHSSPDGSLRSLISYKEGVTATEESEARLGEMRHDRLLLMVNDLSLRFRSFLIPLSLVIHPRNRSQGNGDRMNWSETRPSDYNSLHPVPSFGSLDSPSEEPDWPFHFTMLTVGLSESCPWVVCYLRDHEVPSYYRSSLGLVVTSLPRSGVDIERRGTSLTRERDSIGSIIICCERSGPEAASEKHMMGQVANCWTKIPKK